MSSLTLTRLKPRSFFFFCRDWCIDCFFFLLFFKLQLRECDAVLENDYFLSSLRDQFMQNARLFIFETYCRVHQCIRLDMLAEKLNLSVDDAERYAHIYTQCMTLTLFFFFRRWIVDLIRNARLDAKIDSATGTVVMGTPVKSIYQKVRRWFSFFDTCSLSLPPSLCRFQVIEQTKDLSIRSQMLASTVEKRLVQQQQRQTTAK